MEEIKRLIELKKKELDDVRKRKFEVEKELEDRIKELEALKKIMKIIDETPGIAGYITIRR